MDDHARNVSRTSIGQAQDAIAGTKSAVADLEVEPPKQGRERIMQVALGCRDRISNCRHEGWQLLDQSRGTRLDVLSRAAHVLSLIADKGAATAQAGAGNTEHEIEVLPRCDEVPDFLEHLF